MKLTINRVKTFFSILSMLTILSCQSKEKTVAPNLDEKSWEQMVEDSKGKEVHFMMWQGNPVINQYIQSYLVPEVKKQLQIDLKISGGQGAEIVQLVRGELEAGVSEGQMDMVWINGETFFQLRQLNALWGPFVDKLPNSQYINFEDPFIHTDFQQAVNYMECPWSIGQFAMVYDSAKVSSPPRDLASLAAYVKQYPGSFTISNDFTGMTLLKSFLAELAGGAEQLQGPFNESRYKVLSAKLWDYINENKKYFWKQGQTFPTEQTMVGQLFANGELYIDYGFGEGGIEEKVLSGLYPKSSKVYAWEAGNIKNANFLGILSSAPNKEAAMQVINFMISPEAQFQKADVNGMNSNTILDLNKLPLEWKRRFKEAPIRQYGLALDDLKAYAIPEPAPEYMIRLYDDFRKEVIEK